SLEFVAIFEERAVDRRLDRAGSHRVDGDPQGCKLDGQIASQRFHSAFARAIWRKTWERQLVVYGADIDDFSTLPRAHPSSDRRLRDKEQPLEVDVQDQVIIFFADFPKRRVLLDAGIVHEDIQFGEMGDRL